MRTLLHCQIFLLALLAISCTDESAGTTESNAPAAMKEEQVSFTSDTVNMNGFVVYKDSGSAKKPVIIVVPEWWGLNDYVKNRARQLAELGYVAMAIDVYGDEKTAASPDEAMKLAGPFYADPALTKSRLDAAIAKARTLPQADTSKMAAIGYCFGGTVVLNAAKLGADLDGVVSFHGALAGPAPDKRLLKAQILVCHGAADGFVPVADSLSFRAGLDSIGAVYQFKSYTGAKHAFTNPEADSTAKKYSMDIAYNEAADKASWEDMKLFFERIFR